jgi:hypothetical protein
MAIPKTAKQIRHSTQQPIEIGTMIQARMALWLFVASRSSALSAVSMKKINKSDVGLIKKTKRNKDGSLEYVVFFLTLKRDILVPSNKMFQFTIGKKETT